MERQGLLYGRLASLPSGATDEKGDASDERNNCRMRHWFGRFKRKSIIVSKSVEMVNVTVALFAKFRVNGDVLDILKIGQIEPNIII